MSDAIITPLPRPTLPRTPGLYSEKPDPRTWGDLWMLTDTGWWHSGRVVATHGVPARLHRVSVVADASARPLNHTESQLISRAVEAWAWARREEGRENDRTGTRDTAQGFYAQADQAQGVLNLIPWLRVTG